ncbi:AfsR/SARP family transcriptional regulator [Kutzneria buriramensis]|uniref:DNA-binding SARP family transcriptional activator n=1 Tax=Kutzneria buriramensis TaxID=1045776 RepID=A0A3E0HPZ0_9PSEU|nr:AfsR/SARP family transcriptional regulator [Kutzneria buriramensis]REH48477.1 DNA-binding SARP family transcriptional activator [Kutzneria buriramensis]
MEFRVLGPVEAEADGEQIALDGAKQRTVLAVLLLERDSVVSDQRISELVWGHKTPATLNAQIYTYVSRLRKTLGPGVRIVRRSPGYLLQIGGSGFDLADFTELATRGAVELAADRHEAAAKLLRGALTCWRGPALANVTEHLASAEAPRLEEARIAALEQLFEAETAVGRHWLILPELVRQVDRHPLRERLRAQLMTALYRCERQAEALAVYDEGRRVLAAELGIDPGPLLRGVHRAILTSDPRLGNRGSSLAAG